jgi:hypothetical protein
MRLHRSILLWVSAAGVGLAAQQHRQDSGREHSQEKRLDQVGLRQFLERGL